MVDDVDIDGSCVYGDIYLLFEKYDPHGDGYISKREVENLLKRIAPTLSERDFSKLWRSLDKSNSGRVLRRDFLTYIFKQNSYAGRRSMDFEVLAAFRQLDLDGSGMITADEVRQAMKDMEAPLSEAEVEEQIKQMDTSNDGLIDYHEFARLFRTARAEVQIPETITEGVEERHDLPVPILEEHPLDETVIEAFQIFDQDNSGKITRDEIVKALRHMGVEFTDEELEEQIEQMDTSGDGKIDYVEFATLFATAADATTSPSSCSPR
mmetsp:Transcript_46489/g.108322  ORF Transcript_46489/g.108322 Transcript_46489/m.108322 type:complete len:266 (-) Transcript_46489:131-928(-)